MTRLFTATAVALMAAAPMAIGAPLEVWAADPLVKVFQDAKPATDTEAHADVARGEHASLQVVVRSDAEIKALTARVTPLKLQGGEHIRVLPVSVFQLRVGTEQLIAWAQHNSPNI